MSKRWNAGWPAAGLAAGLTLAGAGCADWDNPTALSELRPETSFEVAAEPVETFEEIPIRVRIREDGEPMLMKRVLLEVHPATGGATRTIEMEPEQDGFAARVLFFEAGQHHLKVLGMPEKHFRFREMGELELEVRPQHREIGPYWVEMEVSPAPVLEGGTARIRFRVFERTPAGTPGAELEGLKLSAEVHDPLGGEGPAIFVDPTEPHEAVYTFSVAGSYDLHLTIGPPSDAEELAGEFRLVALVPDLLSETPPEEEGDGHDHGG